MANDKYIFCKYGRPIEVFDENDNSIFYAERFGIITSGKPIHVYAGKYSDNEVLTILPPKRLKEISYLLFPIIPRIEFNIRDTKTGEVIGSVFHNSGIRITKDDWYLVSIKNSKKRVVGKFESLKYFFHGLIMPRHYKIVTSEGEVVGTLKQMRSLITYKYILEIEEHGIIDIRLLIAAGIVIEVFTISF